MKVWFALGSLALLAACAGASNAGSAASASPGAASSGSGTPSVAVVGQPAPGWSLPSVPSGTLTMASLKGRPVYLNFFATWCPPCNEEAPSVNALQKAYASKGLQVVGVDVLENAAKAAQFRKQHALDYPAVVDDGTLRDQYNINGMPVHAFIDRTGVVKNIVVGELTEDEMRANVERILK